MQRPGDRAAAGRQLALHSEGGADGCPAETRNKAWAPGPRPDRPGPPPTAAARSFFGASLISSFHSCYFYSKICLQLSVCHLRALWCPDPAPAAVILASTPSLAPSGSTAFPEGPRGSAPLPAPPLASAYCPCPQGPRGHTSVCRSCPRLGFCLCFQQCGAVPRHPAGPGRRLREGTLRLQLATPSSRARPAWPRDGQPARATARAASEALRRPPEHPAALPRPWL